MFLNGPVGVGGLLLGGVRTYFSSVNGLTSNSVLQYELFTADRRIPHIKRESYPELFWALRGGSMAFRTVTFEDLKPYPLVNMSAGYLDQDAAYIRQLADATLQFSCVRNRRFSRC